MRSFLLIILVLVIEAGQAQPYRFHLYRVEQGLPSDVIKAVAQDDLGFIWIATDDGLVKYDGIKFTGYKRALRSPYAKGFIHTRDGRLLVFSDLDLVEIDNKIDTVIFRSMVQGQRFQSDSTLWYPKNVYEDKYNKLWVAEPKSVVRVDGRVIKRFEFSEENRSPVFVRSFNFFEDDDGFFYAVSYVGNVFRYDPANDRFVQQKNFRLPDEVSHVMYFRHRLLVASRTGVFSAGIERGLIQNPQTIFPARSVSHLLLAHDSSVVVSTYLEDMYRLRIGKDVEFDALHYNFNGINHCFESNEHDLWASTDKGIVRVQKNLFISADPFSQGSFIEGITRDSANNRMFYASKEVLVQLDHPSDGQWHRTVLMNEKTNYFQGLVHSEQGLWAATSWKLHLLRSGKRVRTWDFSQEGNFVHDLFLARDGNLWVSQAGSSHVKRISPDLSLRHFNLEGFGQNEVNAMCEGTDGIFAVANGVKTYLFLKEVSDTVFRNVSFPLPFEPRGDFTVSSCAAQEDVLWLATTEGVLRYDGRKISTIAIGEDWQRFPVSCVRVLDERHIVFNNSFGLIRYNIVTGDYWLYDENVGLPSNTITDHGIFVDEHNKVWLGTSYGLGVSDGDIVKSEKTKQPYCVDARVNGTTTRYLNNLQVSYNAYLTMQFSAITFPEKKIIYQWRLDSGRWRSLDRGLLSLSNVKEGPHTVQVRAKKNTGFSWSDPAVVKFRVDLPYWKKAEFISLVMIVVVLIAWASFAISSAIMSQRRRYLQQQIDAQTQELKFANEELTLRNTELDRFVYSASHDLSAPLKSILGLIQVAKMDNPGDMHSQYLRMMEKSVYKLEDFIQEVVTYSRNTRMPVLYERLSFRAFVESLLQDHQYSDNFEHIQFIIEDGTNGEMISDPVRLKIILNNLLSNAIKFHWTTAERKPYVKISLHCLGAHYKLTVKDNGKGIHPDHIKRIFEMFYRATDTTQGSGLGLYILKESVLKLGGTVEAASALEEGTEFTILLPVPPKT